MTDMQNKDLCTDSDDLPRTVAQICKSTGIKFWIVVHMLGIANKESEQNTYAD